jgi:hypothetical protein
MPRAASVAILWRSLSGGAGGGGVAAGGSSVVGVVIPRLTDPRALDFVLNFAKDNDLAIEEACEFEPSPQTRT